MTYTRVYELWEWVREEGGWNWVGDDPQLEFDSEMTVIKLVRKILDPYEKGPTQATRVIAKVWSDGQFEVKSSGPRAV